MRRVKQAFQWRRSFSAMPQPVEIPAGAPVELSQGAYWVQPVHFGDEILRHDAAYHGCPVTPDNVEEVDYVPNSPQV